MNRAGLHLVLTVCDQRTGDRVEKVFTHFPVRVGRGAGNDLRLKARSVSRQHGVFAHQRGALLQYMDLQSENGTFLDGIRIEPQILVRLRDSDVLLINPYRLTFYFRQGRPRPDRHVTEALPPLSAGPPSISLWKDTLARSEAVRLIRGRHSPSDLLRQAAEAIEVLAETIVLFRRPRPRDPSILRASKAPDEITAYLMSPSGGGQSLRELRDLLLEMFSQPPSSGARS
jgi:hypothetical protein